MPSGHYLLENGIISHNSGALYNTSVINFLYKAKLDETKESKKVNMRKSGIVVRSAPSKNRFARPITIRFHISFYHGMNPYVGLEQFMSWETCGIAKGNLHTEKEYAKWSEKAVAEGEEKGYTWTDENGVFHAFWPKETARNYVVKHLNATVKPAEIFTAKVFTKELLHELDEKIIKPTFELPKVGDLNDGFETLLEDDLEKEVEEEKSVEDHLDSVLSKSDKKIEDVLSDENESEENIGTP